MLLNLRMGLIMAAMAAVLVGGAYFKGRWDASAACDARHAEVQLKVVEKVRKTDAKIKRAAPDDTDKQLAIKWLLEHIRQ